MEQKRFITLFLAAIGLVVIIILLFWFSGFRSEPAVAPSPEPFLIEDTLTGQEYKNFPQEHLLPPESGLMPGLSPSPLLSPSPSPT